MNLPVNCLRRGKSTASTSWSTSVTAVAGPVHRIVHPLWDVGSIRSISNATVRPATIEPWLPGTVQITISFPRIEELTGRMTVVPLSWYAILPTGTERSRDQQPTSPIVDNVCGDISVLRSLVVTRLCCM